MKVEKTTSLEPTQITSAGLLQFMDISPDALATINRTGRVVMVNSQTEALFGYSPGEMPGLQIEMLLPQRFREAHSTYRNHYFSNPLTRPMGVGLQLLGLRKDGVEFPVDISLRPLLLDNVYHVISAIRDISKQKVLEEQLQRKHEELEVQYRRVQEANRLKSEFLANMSHELRTPLNGIIGFTKMLHQEMVGPVSDQQKEYLGDILSNSKHLLQLINDVLDLTKVESGRMTFDVDLKKLVQEVCDMLRPLIVNKRLYVKNIISSALTEVLVDPVRFKQVLYNYLSNAIKFTPDEGNVVIRVQPEGASAFRLEVEDSGIGIQSEDLELLFIEFQQLDTSAAKKYQGTGLGLALTRRIVEAQGGNVGVQSVPGRGSTFFAVLPRETKAVTVEEKEPEV